MDITNDRQTPFRRSSEVSLPSPAQTAGSLEKPEFSFSPSRNKMIKNTLGRLTVGLTDCKSLSAPFHCSGGWCSSQSEVWEDSQKISKRKALSWLSPFPSFGQLVLRHISNVEIRVIGINQEKILPATRSSEAGIRSLRIITDLTHSKGD